MKLVTFSMEITVRKSASWGAWELMKLGKKMVPPDSSLRKRIGIPVNHATSHHKIHRNNGKHF